jgi:hypothetical protein
MYEKLKQIAKKQSSSFAELDDIIAEAFIYIAEIGCEDLEQAVTKARKKLVNHEIKHNWNKAKSIYGDDGECLDDNYYFVDERTVEKFGEGKRISDDLLARGQALANTIVKTNLLVSRFIRNKKNVNRKYCASNRLSINTVLNYARCMTENQNVYLKNKTLINLRSTARNRRIKDARN